MKHLSDACPCSCQAIFPKKAAVIEKSTAGRRFEETKSTADPEEPGKTASVAGRRIWIQLIFSAVDRFFGYHSPSSGLETIRCSANRVAHFTWRSSLYTTFPAGTS